MGLGIAEIDQHPVAEILGHKAGEAGDRVRDGAVVRTEIFDDQCCLMFVDDATAVS